MRFLLITTTKKDFIKVWLCQQTSNIGSVNPPIDLVSIGTVLKNNSHQVKIADLRLETKPILTYKTILTDFKPHALILNLTTSSAAEDYTLLHNTPRNIKKIAFGAHAIAFSQEAFNQGVNFILWGDPEKAIINLINSKMDKNSAIGVITPKKQSNKPALYNNLDDLPFLDLSLINIKNYFAPYVQKGNPFTFLLSSRGCPFSCSFCQNPIFFGNQYRKQSVKRMVDELQYLNYQFGIKEFIYLDGTFNISEKTVNKFCQEIIKRNLNLNWSVNMRAVPSSLDMLCLMKKAGCRRLMFGVEDFSLLKGIKKKLNKKEILQAFQNAKKAHLIADAYLMVFPNTPWTEKEHANHLLEILKTINADSFQCNVAIPLPGTPYFQCLNKKITLSKNWSLYDPGGNKKLPYSCKNDLIKIKKWVYLKYPFVMPRQAFKVLLNSDKKSLLALIKKYFQYTK